LIFSIIHAEAGTGYGKYYHTYDNHSAECQAFDRYEYIYSPPFYLVFVSGTGFYLYDTVHGYIRVIPGQYCGSSYSEIPETPPLTHSG
jgi:hypothetical protein